MYIQGAIRAFRAWLLKDTKHNAIDTIVLELHRVRKKKVPLYFACNSAKC